MTRIRKLLSKYGVWAHNLSEELLNNDVTTGIKKCNSELEAIIKEDFDKILLLIKNSNAKIRIQDITSDQYMIRKGFFLRNEQINENRLTKSFIAHFFDVQVHSGIPLNKS